MKSLVWRKKYLWFIGVVLLFLLLWPLNKMHSQSFKFVDEEEYLVVGSLIVKGNILYTDISTNRQPLTYFLSAAVQKAVEPQGVFGLIKTHRTVVFLWAFLWSLLLVRRLGKKSLIPIIIFEIIKYLVLGYQFLAESLVVYPLMYLFGAFYDQLIEDEVKPEDFGLGVLSIGSVLFSLPLAIPVFLMMGLRYFFHKGKGLSRFALGVLLVVGIMMMLINPSDYFQETIVNNYLYAAPLIIPINSITDYLKLLILPLTAFMSKVNILSLWIRLMSLVLIGGFLIMLVKSKVKLILSFVILFFIFGLINARVSDASSMYYKGFHFIPWLGVGFMLSWWWFLRVLSEVSKKQRRLLLAGIGFLSLLLMLHKKMPYFEKIDPLIEHHVNYTGVVTIGNAVKALANDQDRLLVVPHEVLVYWVSNVNLATKQVTYYEWQFQVPNNQKAYLTMIENDPSEFVHYSQDDSSYFVSLLPLVNREYIHLKTKDNEPTLLYVHRNKAKEITDEQWVVIEEMGFTKPEQV